MRKVKNKKKIKVYNLSIVSLYLNRKGKKNPKKPFNSFQRKLEQKKKTQSKRIKEEEDAKTTKKKEEKKKLQQRM